MTTLMFPRPTQPRYPFDCERSIFSVSVIGEPLALHIARLWRNKLPIDAICIDDPLLARESSVLAALNGIAPTSVVEGQCDLDISANRVPLRGGRIVEFCTAADILQFSESLLADLEPHIHKEAIVEDGAHISGIVRIERGARISTGAILRGPVYIGAHAMVSNYALVRDFTSLDEECLVGYCTDVKNTIAGARTMFGPHMAALDSVIGCDCFFAGGVRTGNMRLDKTEIQLKIGDTLIGTGRDRLGMICGDNVRVGLLSGIMPGRILASNTHPSSALLPER